MILFFYNLLEIFLFLIILLRDKRLKIRKEGLERQLIYMVWWRTTPVATKA